MSKTDYTEVQIHSQAFFEEKFKHGTWTLIDEHQPGQPPEWSTRHLTIKGFYHKNFDDEFFCGYDGGYASGGEFICKKCYELKFTKEAKVSFNRFVYLDD